MESHFFFVILHLKFGIYMSYSVIDLFAGAGGLSYGFEQAGFSVKLAVEKDAWAVETYLANHQNGNCVEADITGLEDGFFAAYKGQVDVVMGGPPCQGFSIAASNRRDKNDQRNLLYREFLRVVSVVEPKIVLIENVKEFGKYILPEGGLLVDDVAKRLSRMGYDCQYMVADIGRYGIPQDRRRFFLLGMKYCPLDFNLKEALERFACPPMSLGEAIGDLPEVKPWQYKDGDTMPYTGPAENDFQRRMRGESTEVCNHIPMQHTPKTVEKFKFLLEGGEKQDLPDELRSFVRGNVGTISKSKYSQNHRVLDAGKISPTITASFYSSFIHPSQPRNLTVREAARIQTFPDTFVFHGKKTTLSKKLLKKKGIDEDLHLDQFNQVGNAVPPMMAQIMARICKKLLEEAK